MIYSIENNNIRVYDKTQFNPKHILECGQVFRYGINDDGNYFVYSNKYKATILEKPEYYEIISNNTDYFVNYFDLKTDYNLIKNKLKTNKVLSPMIDYGYGIRILNADTEEMIYSFILSQNNNIKRIQKIVEKMCEIGENMGDYKAFPTSKNLSKLPFEFYKNLGAGYRDKFLKSTADFLSLQNLEDVKKLSTDEILSYLLKINGIGPKVASCVLLFGFGRKEKFPVDTWLEQVYYNHFSKEKRTRDEMQKYFENEFGEYSGVAQQYLFYYERNNSTNNK
ncbi:MAG: DNA-3-methyladenine glycosylase 2 [Clostridia bacterium]|nr:DNA-3-methyladenine glycosylase 2 [Clostridia bacterium]